MRLHYPAGAARQQGENRVKRGGSWNNNGRRLRAAYRNHNQPDERNDNLGFRLAAARRGPVRGDQRRVLSRCPDTCDGQSREGWYVSSTTPKAYQRLASVLAALFGPGSDESQGAPPGLPEPGSPWPDRPPPAFPMPWATHWGQDAFGLWCGFSVGESLQRMRWIPPGEFRMGSPQDEPERGKNETPHRVVLSRGFWLAETACPQALWRAVTGEDPSDFKGADLPVEQVSWEEVQGFCRRLNERVPGLGARLPSEAEWEYACRAGTGTPFWWGERLSPELANYNGNYPYAGGPKGEYREKTLPVKSFEPNPWGLYQMHGNVWEWCGDWYDAYPDGETVDPTGPEQGEGRVLRGGGWYDVGGWLRAAYRVHFQPGVRGGLLGFRLAAGPRPGGAGESGGDEDTAASGSGSGRRSRGSGHSGGG